jgi:hypothetical protein
MKRQPIFDPTRRLAVAREWVALGGRLDNRRIPSSVAATRHIRRLHRVPVRTLRLWLDELARHAPPAGPPWWVVLWLDQQVLMRAAPFGGTVNTRWHYKPTAGDPRVLYLELDQWLRGVPVEDRGPLLDAAARHRDLVATYAAALNELRKDQQGAAGLWDHEPPSGNDSGDETPEQGKARARLMAVCQPPRPRTVNRTGEDVGYRDEEVRERPQHLARRWVLVGDVWCKLVRWRDIIRSIPPVERAGWRFHVQRYTRGLPSSRRRGRAVPEHEHAFRDAYAIRNAHDRAVALAVASQRWHAVAGRHGPAWGPGERTVGSDDRRWVRYRWPWGEAPKRVRIWKLDPHVAARERWKDRTLVPEYRRPGRPWFVT